MSTPRTVVQYLRIPLSIKVFIDRLAAANGLTKSEAASRVLAAGRVALEADPVGNPQNLIVPRKGRTAA